MEQLLSRPTISFHEANQLPELNEVMRRMESLKLNETKKRIEEIKERFNDLDVEIIGQCYNCPYYLLKM